MCPVARARTARAVEGREILRAPTRTARFGVALRPTPPHEGPVAPPLLAVAGAEARGVGPGTAPQGAPKLPAPQPSGLPPQVPPQPLLEGPGLTGGPPVALQRPRV